MHEVDVTRRIRFWMQSVGLQIAIVDEEERMASKDREMVVNVSEYEAIAKQRLPKMVFDFYASGAEDQRTLYLNRAAFSTIRLCPRILVDVTEINLSTSVLGFKIPMPIMIAPTALHKMAHPQGELATARAAKAAGTIMVLSMSSSCSIEEIAQIENGIRFFQLYVYKQRRIAEELVHRAEKAGYRAIVLTVDTPRLGRREPDIRNRFVLPPGVSMKNVEPFLAMPVEETKGSSLEAFAGDVMDSSVSWKDIQWLQSLTKLPIILKGVLTGEDAWLAVQAGVAGIIVSNHGARQLDYVYPSILALEEVVRAVQGHVPVFLDGGIRRGTDIFKALAMGATAVLIGRPIIFALAADGEAGVSKVLQMLRDELELTMTLAGCRMLKDVKRSHVQVDLHLAKL